MGTLGASEPSRLSSRGRCEIISLGAVTTGPSSGIEIDCPGASGRPQSLILFSGAPISFVGTAPFYFPSHVARTHLLAIAPDANRFVFSRDEDGGDEYLLIQRHFEQPDDGRPYIETDDVQFSGHFRDVTAILERNRLEIRYGSRIVAVSFVISEESFAGVATALGVLFPNLKAEGGSEAARPNGG